MNNIVDNSGKLLKSLEQKLELACEMIGAEMETHAKEDCPVDTGRLRNSITYAIKGKQGSANTMPGALADPEEYKKLAEPEKKTVYVGTNVKYALKNELNDMKHTSGKAHFLRDSVALHVKEYKEIAITVLKK